MMPPPESLFIGKPRIQVVYYKCIKGFMITATPNIPKDIVEKLDEIFKGHYGYRIAGYKVYAVKPDNVNNMLKLVSNLKSVAKKRGIAFNFRIECDIDLSKFKKVSVTGKEFTTTTTTKKKPTPSRGRIIRWKYIRPSWFMPRRHPRFPLFL